MATLKQMVPTVRQITTGSGKTFDLPRPTISLRMAVVDFVERARGLEARTADGDVSALRELSEAMLDVLEPWLRKTCPEITREEIADNWDTSDIPAFLEAANGFEEEIEAAIPPASGAPRSTRRSPRA